MNNLFVYCEIEDGIVADVSLELLTKGRSLANQLGCQLEAVVAGTGLKDIEKQILPYGVDMYSTVKDFILILHSPTLQSWSICSKKNNRKSA